MNRSIRLRAGWGGPSSTAVSKTRTSFAPVFGRWASSGPRKQSFLVTSSLCLRPGPRASLLAA
eukprot:7193782-Alexandrium_andersonii.AAC.1